MECCDPPLSRMPKGELLNHIKKCVLLCHISLVLMSDSSEVYRFLKRFFHPSYLPYTCGFGTGCEQRSVKAFSLGVMYIINTLIQTQD